MMIPLSFRECCYASYSMDPDGKCSLNTSIWNKDPLNPNDPGPSCPLAQLVVARLKVLYPSYTVLGTSSGGCTCTVSVDVGGMVNIRTYKFPFILNDVIPSIKWRGSMTMGEFWDYVDVYRQAELKRFSLD